MCEGEGCVHEMSQRRCVQHFSVVTCIVEVMFIHPQSYGQDLEFCRMGGALPV